MSKCKIWPHAKTPKGYGVMRSDGKIVYAHRARYEAAHGPIPDGMVVAHSCDNPSCVNIEHLSAIRQRENLQQMGERGRAWNQRGEYCSNGHSKELHWHWIDQSHGYCRPCRLASKQRWNRKRPSRAKTPLANET